MSTENQRLQGIIRLYKMESGIKEVDMRQVAAFAAARGMSLPNAPSQIDLLAKKFSKAAREEIRYDDQTKRPYRANHAFTNDQQLTLWVDIDEAPRRPMVLSVNRRREQMVGDAFQLTLDAEHWNRVNPGEEPIAVPLDLTDDVEWRMNTPTDDEEAA